MTSVDSYIFEAFGQIFDSFHGADIDSDDGPDADREPNVDSDMVPVIVEIYHGYQDVGPNEEADGTHIKQEKPIFALQHGKQIFNSFRKGKLEEAGDANVVRSEEPVDNDEACQAHFSDCINGGLCVFAEYQVVSREAAAEQG